MPTPESLPEQAPKLASPREILFLADQAAEGGMKALPSQQWSLHYPQNGAIRAERLQGLLSGTYEPAAVAQDLKPDAVLYDVNDIERIGLKAVTARIQELTSTAAHGDYVRFANFVSAMQGKSVDINTLQSLYDGITKSRTRGKLLDAYGTTGRKQIETALKHEAEQTEQSFDVVRGTDRVLEALKMQWMERSGLASTQQASSVIDRLNKREQTLLSELGDMYNAYVDKGDNQAFESLTEHIRDQLPEIEKLQNQMSPEGEKLLDELEELMQDMPLPGTPGDSAIPPDDEDEYHTSEPGPGESMEKGPASSIFEITHAGKNKDVLVGYYASGRKSYYDIQTKTWSKRKQLTPYTTKVEGNNRYSISGRLSGDLKSLPIPTGYCLDASSLSFEGAEPELFRDQKGCFYVQPKGPCFFSVDFLKENLPVGESPIAEDLAPLTHQAFSAESEQLLASLGGSVTDNVKKIVRHVHGHHFYPGGGDLKMAQALQHKLRTESDGEEYLQKLEQSEYLECYSSNTLFIGLCRRAGIPARLVIGHKIDGASGGTAAITESTGHAWSEFWDGNAWRRVDATPPSKPEDKKEEKEKSDQPPPSPSSQANDGGIETPPEHDLTNQMRDRMQQQLDNVQNQQMSQSGEQDIQQGESILDQAKKTMDRMQKERKSIEDRIKEAEKFNDLDKVADSISESDLFDDMKNPLEKMREEKKKKMKEELKDNLNQMEKDGFLDKQKNEELQERIDYETTDLDKLQEEIEEEKKDFLEYDRLREEVQPLVDHWYRRFVELLPKEPEMQTDETVVGKRGLINRRAAMRPRNLIFNTLRNPRVFQPSIKPRFIASILIDVSGSMEKEGKLFNAQKLLVFYSELFTLISNEFGYIRFNINVFADGITEIKRYDQKYDSPQRYQYDDGSESTVKVRLMRSIHALGGTDMLSALKKASEDLNGQARKFPDHASALYFLGDGDDTCHNQANIQKFLHMNEEEGGFGTHMKSAILLGQEKDRKILANLFGDENTTVAGDFESLVERSMDQFAHDIGHYTKRLAA